MSTATGEAVQAPQFDRTQAWGFLRILDPEASTFTFQTFDDSPAKRKHLARTLHGSLDDVWDKLCRLSSYGAGVFVTVNETDLIGRKAKNVVRVRALFADLDGANPKNIFRIPLSLAWVQRTSLQRVHAFWKVEGIHLDEFTMLQKAIAARTGSDPQICDLPRVMRLPGFPHQKHEPILVKGQAVGSGKNINGRENVMVLLQGGAADATAQVVKGPWPNVPGALPGGFGEPGELERRLAAKTSAVTAPYGRPFSEDRKAAYLRLAEFADQFEDRNAWIALAHALARLEDPLGHDEASWIDGEHDHRLDIFAAVSRATKCYQENPDAEEGELERAWENALKDADAPREGASMATIGQYEDLLRRKPETPPPVMAASAALPQGVDIVAAWDQHEARVINEHAIG